MDHYNGYGVLVWDEDKKVLEMDGGDYTKIWMSLMPLHGTLKGG